MIIAVAAPSEMTYAKALLCVAAILVVGAVLGRLVTRFGQPAVIGEMAGGIILGPSLLGLLPGDLTNVLFPPEVRPMLAIIAQVGLLLFMCLIGWEFEIGLVKNQRAVATAVSVSSVVLSFGLGAALALVLYANHASAQGKDVPKLAFVLFLGAAMAVTAFPVLARVLIDRGLLSTKVGALALASAAVDDVLAWFLLAIVSAVVSAGDGGHLLRVVLLSCAYIVLMFVVVRPLLARVVRKLGRAGLSPSLLVLVVGGVFVSSYVTTWIGIHAIFGAFLFGFVLPREPAETLETTLRRPLVSMSTMLLPVFFIVAGLSVDIGQLTGREYVELLAMIVVACVGKLAGAILPARAFGMSWRDARGLGVLMNMRGLTGLIILNAGVSLGVLDTQMFTMMVITALVTTAMAGPLLPGRSSRPAQAGAPQEFLPEPTHAGKNKKGLP